METFRKSRCSARVRTAAFQPRPTVGSLVSKDRTEYSPSLGERQERSRGAQGISLETIDCDPDAFANRYKVSCSKLKASTLHDSVFATVMDGVLNARERRRRQSDLDTVP